MIEENKMAETKLDNKLDSLALINKKISPHFPWLSIAASAIFIEFFLISSDQELSAYYKIVDSWLNIEIKSAFVLLLGLIYMLDLRLFLRKKNQIKKYISHLQNQLKIVSDSKKKQQQRANKFFDHTEKLKFFISDKLLEYMEYDEKFIHFKGIASEVRHNGVISYDKVITALNHAIEQQKFLFIYEQNNSDDSDPNQHTINALTDYQSAIDAMRYLWDLLDLSTADNMSLHIGNKLIECEEHYYQLQLDSHKTLDMTQSIPTSPTFFPQIAVLMTFALISDDVEIRNRIALAKINESILEEPFSFENEQFHIMLEATPSLLGNHNHVILLLENLIKNAQFFISKNRFKQKTDRIVVRLQAKDGYALFSIYNRGPHIKVEAMDEIFKLGFSTRKNKQHHGKGLGLFFAREIVRGYQGSIQASNIENTDSHFLLVLNLASGESKEYKIGCQFDDHKISVKLETSSEWLNEISIQPDIPIENIAVKSIDPDSKNEIDIYTSNTIEKSEAFDWLEPSENGRSRWKIQLKPYKNKHQLLFKPLDINGVCFEIKLPTANSRLNEQELEF